MRILRSISCVLAIALLATAFAPMAARAGKEDPKQAAEIAKKAEANKKKQAEAELTMKLFGQLISDYNEKPDVKLAVTILRNFQAHSPHSPQIVAASDAFVAGLIYTNPEFVTLLAPIYYELTDTTAMGLPRAILMSGRDDWQERLAQLQKLWPGRAKLMDELASRGARPIPDMDPLAHPSMLEMLWAYYGATGSPKAVETLVSALGGLKEQSAVARLKTAYAAKYSIAAKASDSPKFAALCKPLVNGPNGEALRDALLAAETSNFDRLNTEANAAILAAAPPPPPRQEKILRKNQR